MTSEEELLAAVEVAFERTALGLRRWDDPHADHDPAEDEYSRCLDPAKWSIVVSRAEAWVEALEAVGLADVERGVAVAWARARGQTIEWDSIDVMRPHTGDGMPVVFAYRSWGDCIDLNGVTVGAGGPVVEVSGAPACGCDACDHGSEMELRMLDDAVLELLTGGVRYLWRGDESIQITRHGRSTVGALDDDQIEAVLADPSGWDEVRGSAWFSA
jgi:hypothetical protein